ncbi:N-acetylglucosamine-binding protein GbpA [Enterobacter mori]|uniref:N-acetylglucosamine-binding protein GbpA n=1 Tax=Enterobacter mori TaxID=539813 RepID=UPI001B8C6AE9|nr:N-acetylglucosamine-binding protein GbpA [Enterobacter mori]MBS3049724.1 N-acetylglucosamine-binding protein GbpA [Enterobacter mori]
MKFNKIMLALVALSISGGALAHGYVHTPESRNFMCSDRGASAKNTDCGGLQYEPQSAGEFAKGFPEKGAIDGKLMSSAQERLNTHINLQTADRWTKNKVKAGKQDFTWAFTAAHPATKFQYYITKQGWDPNKPLTRDSLDLVPFCEAPAGNYQPKPATGFHSDINTIVTHSCELPERTGYHVVYAVWEVSDTANSFHNAIDVMYDGENEATGDGDETPIVSEWTTQVGNILPHMDLAAGDSVKLRVFTAAGERSDLSTELAITDAQSGKKEKWSHALATKVNTERKDLRAGSKDAEGNIVATYGTNVLYTNASSGIVRVEVDIQQTDVEEATNASFTASGLKDTYQLVDGATTVNVDLAAKGKMDLTVKVFDQNNQVKGFHSVTLEDRSERVSLPMKNLTAGKFSMVVIGTDANGKSQQQSFHFTVKGDEKPVVPGSVTAWDPAATYGNACTKVSFKGKTWVNGWWTKNNVPGADGQWGVWRAEGSKDMHSQCK